MNPARFSILHAALGSPSRPTPLSGRTVLESLLTFAMSAALGLIAALLFAGCSAKRIEAAPERSSPPSSAVSAPVLPSIALSPIAADRLCVTKGAASIGSPVTQPTMRAIALDSSGDAASLSFTFRGDTATSRSLASGESRRQLGLKLRAQDGCNLLYVMWRLDPAPSLSVSLKLNPGMRTHRECGARGYTHLKPARSAAPVRGPAPASDPVRGPGPASDPVRGPAPASDPIRGPSPTASALAAGSALAAVPALTPGSSHNLRAEIAGDELLAWIDDALVWRGPLPPSARSLSGPSGLRSDNVRFDLVSFSAAPAPSPASSKCSTDASD